MGIIESYAKGYPGLIHIVEGPPTGGAGDNFFYLMKKVHAQYYLFCDQDDVWLPHKIETELKAIKGLEESVKDRTDLYVKEEGALGSKVPCLAWCDMKVVNEKLEVIDESLEHYLKLAPCDLRLGRYLIGGRVYGCTIITNDSNVKLSLRLKASDLIYGHDNCLFIIARMIGALRYIDESLSLYRQHGANVSGAGHRNTKVFVVCSVIKRLIKGKQLANSQNILLKTVAFIVPLKSIAPIYEKYRELIDGADNFDRAGRIVKARYVRKYQLYQHSFLAGRLWTYFTAFLMDPKQQNLRTK